MTAAPLLAVLVAATAAPSGGGVVIAPPVARPGDAVLVRVRGWDAAPPGDISLAGRPLQFWTQGTERWAIAALPLETTPGRVELRLGAADGRAAATLEVVEPGFPSRTLNVARQFVEPPAKVRKRMEQDRAAFEAAYARPFGPPLFSGSFEWPRKDRTTGKFGDQRVFNGKKESVHYGTDIHGPRGAPVHAANDGQVVLARDCYLSGKTVVLWHGADLFTLYFHLDRIAVRPGARVKKGQRIGAVGSTGRSTGPHLHWSARAAGLLVDPESLLGIDFAAGAAPPRRAGPPEPTPREEPPAAPAPPETAPAIPPSDGPPPGVAPAPAATTSGGGAPPR
jgi:murein DD-endopeptidase MepM/ murein hydrolase activator NlpD